MSDVSEVQPTNDVRRRIHQIVAGFDVAGPDAEPVVFGSHRRAQAVLVPYAAWRSGVAGVAPARDEAPPLHLAGGSSARAQDRGKADSTSGGEPDVGTNLTRMRILRAAVSVLLDKGFPATRIADVATAAEVSAGLVVYYFGTRERLLSAALRHAEEKGQAEVELLLADLPDPRDRLRAWIELSFEPEQGSPVPRSWGLWLDLWQRARTDAEVRAVRDELDASTRRQIAHVVRAGQQQGVFTDTDADDFARMLSAMLDGLAISVLLDDSTLTARRAVTLAFRLCEDELGVVWTAQPPA